MRSAATEAEHRLWQILRAKRLSGHKFKRQLPIDHYIVDFACLSKRLIVEADGGQHGGSNRDTRRDGYLKTQGFRVLRFWNNDIFENEEGVVASILNALSTPHPAQAAPGSPFPVRGEGLSGVSNG
jgi:very-short-patch-repair endonuclease